MVSHLPNGLTLVVQPEDVSDTVRCSGISATGPKCRRPRGQEGISNLLGELLTYGSQNLDRLSLPARPGCHRRRVANAGTGLRRGDPEQWLRPLG